MLEAIPTKKQDLIVKNILKACKNIDALNGTGYGFIYLASGFIAHYSINGFRGYYTSEGSLRRDILRLAGWNQWDNFRPGQEHYEYYRIRKAVYNRIVEGLL